MSALIDLTGQRFNCLTVIERAENTTKGIARWKCKCDCGNYTIVRGSNLKTGAVKSCGCLNHIAYTKTHGESQTKLYRHWRSMIYRCSNPKNRAYKWYGERGIKVCEEWQTYEGFKKWVLETRPKEDYSVERINVNGDYCPENCTWIPLSEQANNRTSCINFEHCGKTMNLMEWCKTLNLDYKRVHNRIFKLGWDFEKAISTPVNENKRNMKTRENYGRIHTE